MQNLKNFELPNNFRGKNIFIVQLWYIVQFLFIRCSPQIFYRWRVWIFRLFGAKIGSHVRIRPSVKVVYPWKLKIGDNSWIGDNVYLYSLGEIEIRKNVVISQNSYICTGSHDHSSENFDIYAKKILIHDSVWIATDVFVGPGITVGNGTVIGARSSVFHDMPSNAICFGNPAKKIKDRLTRNQ